MGNKQSNNKDKNNTDNSEDNKDKGETLLKAVNHIASNYIYELSYEDLMKLDQPEYCNKITLLTADAIKENLNDLEISYLTQRLKDNKPLLSTETGKFIPIWNTDFKLLDIQNSTKKKRVCLGIGKYYVLIFHFFASVTKALNPIITYKDVYGKINEVPLMDKNKVSKAYKSSQSVVNLCDARIHELKFTLSSQNKAILKRTNCNMNRIAKKMGKSMIGGADEDVEQKQENEVIEEKVEENKQENEKPNMVSSSTSITPPKLDTPLIKPPINVSVQTDENKVIMANPRDINDSANFQTEIMMTKKLGDEPGIKELEKLYFDEINLKTDKISFNKMSEKSKEEYKRNLLAFYTTFTGNESIPMKDAKNDDGEPIKNKDGSVVQIPAISKFSQIPLKDFHNQPICKNPDSLWHKSVTVSPNDKLFIEYATHLRKMISNKKEKENLLLQQLKKVFEFDSSHPSQPITINSQLTEKILTETIIPETRQIIVDLFIQCEKDYQTGLGLFESIVKAKALDAAKNRLESLATLDDNLSTE